VKRGTGGDTRVGGEGKPRAWPWPSLIELLTLTSVQWFAEKKLDYRYMHELNNPVETTRRHIPKDDVLHCHRDNEAI
jgi:hypothetical protein